jgi:hypothetical protein
MNRFVLIVVLLALLGVGCSGSVPDDTSADSAPSSEGSPVTIQGTVTYVELEGGFYGILGEDGHDYFPLELDDRFRKDGLRVRFEARKEPALTIQQWGTPVRIVSISAIVPADPVYTINGGAVRIDEPGQDGTVSLLASAVGDLDDDGRDDSGVILRLDSKGSGVFYYLNVFLDQGDDGWRLAGEEFLGDRIEFDFMDIYRQGSVSSLTGVSIYPDDYGQLVVAYSAHSEEQPFSEEHDLYLTKHWRVEEGKLVLMEND